MEWNKKSRTGVDSQAIKGSIPGPAILKDIKLVSVYSSVVLYVSWTHLRVKYLARTKLGGQSQKEIIGCVSDSRHD